MIREAIKEKGMVAIGRVVFASREHIVALEPRGKGMMGITIRYPYEVRDEKEYFDDMPPEKVTNQMLELACHIVKTKQGHFHPEKCKDRYAETLKELIKRKSHGEKIERTEPKEPSNVVNLMEALRASAKGEKRHTERRKARRTRHRASTKTGRSSVRHRNGTAALEPF